MYIFCFPSHGVQICGAATENLRLQPSRDIAKTLERRQRERDSSLAPFSRFLDFHSQRLIFHCFIPFNKSLSNSLSEKEKMEFVNTHFDVKQTAMAFLDSHSHLKSSRKAKKY